MHFLLLTCNVSGTALGTITPAINNPIRMDLCLASRIHQKFKNSCHPPLWFSLCFSSSEQQNELEFCFLCYLLSHFSRVRLFATLWTVACQTPLSMGFSRQEYWSGLLCPPPGDRPSRVSCLLHWQVCSLPLAPPGKPRRPYGLLQNYISPCE